MGEKNLFEEYLELKDLPHDTDLPHSVNKVDTRGGSPRKKRRRLRVIVSILVVGVIVFLAACAPRVNPNPTQGVDAVSTDISSAAATAWWSPESDCVACHDNSVTSLASLTCEAALAGDPNEACMTCHDDVTNVEAAHAEVSITNKAGDDTYLKVSEIQEETCLACHNRDDIIAATAQITDLTDLKGTTVNPHEASTVNNVNGAHDTITCGSCHKMHSGGTPPTVKVAYDYCTECHHTGEFTCNSCH